jgi:hypothetical protein
MNFDMPFYNFDWVKEEGSERKKEIPFYESDQHYTEIKEDMRNSRKDRLEREKNFCHDDLGKSLRLQLGKLELMLAFYSFICIEHVLENIDLGLLNDKDDYKLSRSNGQKFGETRGDFRRSLAQKRTSRKP